MLLFGGIRRRATAGSGGEESTGPGRPAGGEENDMRIPGPTDLLKIAGQGYDAADRAIALLPRVVAVLGDVEHLLGRVGAMMNELELTQRRATALVTRTDDVVSRAENVLGRTEALTNEFASVLERLVPSLDRLEPVIAQLAATTSPDEAHAVVRLIDTLPSIVDKVQADILPVLDTLGTVAPDLRDLLDVSKEFNEMLGSLPGMGRVKKRIEDRQDEEDHQRTDNYRADEIPAAAPDRRS